MIGLFRRLYRWVWRRFHPAPPAEPFVPRKVEWTDERRCPVSVAIPGGLAYEPWMVVDRPAALHVWDALLIDEEIVLVREFRDGRVVLDRAIGGTTLAAHKPGVVAAILGPVAPMTGG